MGRFGHNKDGGVIVFGKRAREASGMCFGNGMMRQVDNLMVGRIEGIIKFRIYVFVLWASQRHKERKN